MPWPNQIWVGNLFVETVTRRISSITEALQRGPTQGNGAETREILWRARGLSFAAALS